MIGDFVLRPNLEVGKSTSGLRWLKQQSFMGKMVFKMDLE